MNELRILLVESNGLRASSLASTLADAHHSPVAVASIEEAGEALLVQKFDLVLLGSGQSPERSASFVSRLRAFENEGRYTAKTIVLSYSTESSPALAIDGSLPLDFDPERLANTLSDLSGRQASTAPGATAADLPFLSLFEPAAFEEQCGHDSVLITEIVDLFGREGPNDLSEMSEALAGDDFDRLSRIAHTLKGSLGALHAPRAQARTYGLEMASRQRDRSLCAALLTALEQDLAELAELLAAFRASRLEP
jgi:two-component system, sensor histidine kinase and response regulator